MPTIKLDGLIPLVTDMRRNKQLRSKFEWRINKAVFDVMLFVDIRPWELLFGTKGKQFSFIKEVKKGYIIETNFNNNEYSQLCKILGLRYDPNNPFSPLNFFTDFNISIPQHIHLAAPPSYIDIARYSRDVEESERIYFYGWLDNSKQNNEVSESNLFKTRRILGEETYKYCSKRNISSKWTDNPRQANTVSAPP